MGRHVAAEGPRHGEADRAGAAQRPVRPVGAPRLDARRLPPAVNPARRQAWGVDSLRLLPELHDPDLEAELVPHVPLLADVVQHAHLRGHPLLRAAEERARAARARSSRPSPSRSTRSRTATRSRPRRRCSSRARSQQFPLGDQEILLRQLHQTAHARYRVDRLRRGALTRTWPPCPPTSPTSSPSPTGVSSSSASATPSGSRARWTRCRRSTTPRSPARSGHGVPRPVPARCAARGRAAPALALLLAGERVVPHRGVAPAPGARQRRGQLRPVVEPAV